MKARESGMPDEIMWNSFFNPSTILTQLECDNNIQTVVEFGCGYGTFTIAAAKIIKGKIYALDIDPIMIETINEKIKIANLVNIKPQLKDFISEGTGLKSRSSDYVMLFNILHTEEPVKLLDEAFRILKHGGKVGIIHWKYCETTPRGPSLEIRPKPEQCANWLIEAGFELHKSNIDLSQYHYGIVGRKV